MADLRTGGLVSQDLGPIKRERELEYHNGFNPYLDRDKLSHRES